MNRIIQFIDKVRITRMVNAKDSLFTPETFEGLSKELRLNKKLLRAFQGSKDVLTAFMVHRFPTDILDNSVFDYYLQYHAGILMSAYNKLIETQKPMYYHFFLYYIPTFVSYFNRWKEQDLHKLIVPMIQEVHRLEGTKTKYLEENSDDAHEIVEHLEKLQVKLKRQMLTLTGKDPDVLVADPDFARLPTMEESFVETFHNTFWRQFYDNTRNKDYTQVPLFIEDIKEMIKKLVPSRADIHETMNTQLDTTLITQMIEAQAMDGTTIFRQMTYIITLVRQLQAAVDDNDTEMFFGLLEDMFKKGFAYEEILTFFFSTVFRKLEKIKHQLSQLS